MRGKASRGHVKENRPGKPHTCTHTGIRMYMCERITHLHTQASVPCCTSRVPLPTTNSSISSQHIPQALLVMGIMDLHMWRLCKSGRIELLWISVRKWKERRHQESLLHKCGGHVVSQPGGPFVCQNTRISQITAYLIQTCWCFHPDPSQIWSED